MNETSFYVDPAKQSRVAALYAYDPSPARKVRYTALENQVFTPRSFDSGGGGLVSTAADYWKFLQMLENGGELNGVRIVSPTTIDLMTLNHIPGNKDISDWGRPMGEEVFYDGLGFGLGFAVVIDQAKTKVACSNGTYSWGGMASTAFWIDPVEEITAMFFTQLMPSTTHPIRPFLRSLVYQSITE
jgi:CubicO group peptidase (beta-lactamase class C family)